MYTKKERRGKALLHFTTEGIQRDMAKWGKERKERGCDIDKGVNLHSAQLDPRLVDSSEMSHDLRDFK